MTYFDNSCAALFPISMPQAQSQGGQGETCCSRRGKRGSAITVYSFWVELYNLTCVGAGAWGSKFVGVEISSCSAASVRSQRMVVGRGWLPNGRHCVRPHCFGYQRCGDCVSESAWESVVGNLLLRSLPGLSCTCKLIVVRTPVSGDPWDTSCNSGSGTKLSSVNGANITASVA